ncbi:fam-l protein [Plasmodium malariae]|uniref:Fam-l protein n=1 Tax=Plasmodium malariae TaxID=5858 RepID=A0A1D3JH32_PLAMA|nr:fam-l protein [Plasmodium malariae]SBT85596.1 fam-l protein [Plasmodium malariae]
MQEKIKSLLFIKITKLILLSWICHIYIHTSTHNKSLNKYYKLRKKLNTKNYRLLTKYNQDKDSNIVYLKENIPDEVHDKKNISNNENSYARKKIQSNGSSSRNTRGCKKVIKNISCMFETKKYSHLEKKIFRELDYVNFLENNRTLSDKLYKRIILKKYSLRLSFTVILFLLLSVAFLVEFFGGYGIVNEIYRLLSTCLDKEGMISLNKKLYDTFLGKLFYRVVETTDNHVKKSALIRNFLGFLVYFSIFFIFGISVILGVVYYHKKVKKYDKIKFRRK